MKVLDDYDKQKIFNFIKTKELFKNFDYSTIGELCTFDVDGNGKNIRGRVEILSTNPLKFRIMLQNDILNTFSISTSSQATVFHEFCHCLEIATTLKYYNYYETYNRPQENTWQIVFSNAIECWSEYFAYFHSCKLREENRNLDEQIEKIHKYKTTIKANFKSGVEIKYNDSLWDTLITIMRKTVILSSCYNSTHNRKYAEKLYLQDVNYKKNMFTDYFADIMHYFNKLYSEYPYWVSEDKFIEIGRKLFSITKYIDLDFSTHDLLDNGILKCL